MGILDEIGAVAGQNMDKTKVAGGLLQALEQHPGGIGGLLNTIRGNGMEDHVEVCPGDGGVSGVRALWCQAGFG